MSSTAMALSIASLQPCFIGLDTEYPLADGTRARRRYLDSAASSLMLRPAWETAQAFLRHYANTHSELHFGARIASRVYAWAHDCVLAFVGADPSVHACSFAGSGSTAGFNRLARSLAVLRPERTVVIASEMEHHSNDLPHRRHAARIEHAPLTGEAPAYGCVDLEALARLLEQHRGSVRYIAITAASNVTGIVNPLREIAALARAHDTWLVVDGSQLLPHAPVRMADGIDFLVFSGHKLYAPGSPGVIVGRRDLLARIEPDEIGGGVIEDVSLRDYRLLDRFPDREEAGTPNIVGAVLLAAALETMMRVGMGEVQRHEQALLTPFMHWLAGRPGVRVYGDLDTLRSPRTGTIAFNLEGLDHALVAAALNDYWAIAVRNACFCAHPYVREMLKPELWASDSELDPASLDGLVALKLRQGMVRASIGLYTTADDLDRLREAIDALLADPQRYRNAYVRNEDYTYTLRHAAASAEGLFDPRAELSARIDACRSAGA
jgi:selenocysteine lyase/cysteine desulfurase